ncbi:MAG: AgmX/PglI C-terminal domain-containing protein [Cystobacter sp.]
MKHPFIMAVVVLSAGLSLAQGSAGKKGAASKQLDAAAIPTADPAPAEKKAAAPAARPQPPDVTKLPFTPDSIRMVMNYYARDIQDCYEEILATKGNKVEEGRIFTTFTISPDGFVRNAKVAKAGTTIHNARLNECVVNVLTSITFPEPSDKSEHPIEYPFNLKAIK